MTDAFISYSRKDKAFVLQLDEALKSRKREAWVDWDGIHKELTFVREKEGAIVTPENPEETLATGAAPLQDGLAKDTPAEAVSGETSTSASMPGASPAVARQSLQGRKKDHR